VADTNGNPDNNEMYDHWRVIQSDASNRMNLARALQEHGDDLTSAAKAVKLAASKAGTGHNPSSCGTCQAYAGLPPAQE
jgi:hypothetical protein